MNCKRRRKTPGPFRHSGARVKRANPESRRSAMALDSGFALRALRNDSARRKGQLPERIGQLAGDFGRNGLVVHPVIVWKPVLGHPEGSEQDIPDREGPREIGITALLLRGVVPAVEYRSREHVFE